MAGGTSVVWWEERSTPWRLLPHSLFIVHDLFYASTADFSGGIRKVFSESKTAHWLACSHR